MVVADERVGGTVAIKWERLEQCEGNVDGVGALDRYGWPFYGLEGED